MKKYKLEMLIMGELSVEYFDTLKDAAEYIESFISELEDIVSVGHVGDVRYILSEEIIISDHTL